MVADFHCHVLPQMDDGSDSVETTRTMLAALAAQGVSDVCATPHYDRTREPIDAFLERREASWNRLQRETDGAGPRIHLGAEVAFFLGISQVPDLEALCLQDSGVLLLEMPYTQWTPFSVDEVISLALDRKLRVILAHVERYGFASSNGKSLHKFVQAGVGFQVNADSLLHWRTRKRGLSLLGQSCCPILATDAHDMRKRPPRLAEARQIVRKRMGQEFLQYMDGCASKLLTSGLSEEKP